MSLDKIKKALEGVEIDFNLDDLHITTKADFNTMVDNYKVEIEETKVKSQTIGQEILLKELKNDLGFDYEGRKDPAKLKKAYQDKFGKAEGSDDDIETLRTNLTNDFTKQLEAKDLEVDSIKSKYKNESDNKAINDSLRNSFSEFSSKTHLSVDDFVTLAKSKGSFLVEDGNVYQSKEGEVIKDSVSLVKSTTDDFARTFMTDGNYIKKATGGKVIGDEVKGGKVTMDQFMASQKNKGIVPGSTEDSDALNAAVLAGQIEL